MAGIESGEGSDGGGGERWTPEAPAETDDWTVPEPEALPEASAPNDIQPTPNSDADIVSGIGAVALDGAQQAETESTVGRVALDGAQQAETEIDIGRLALGDSVEVSPAESADQGPGVDGADSGMYFSEQAEQRAELWDKQGVNDHGYEGTCGLASSAEMISDQTGERVTEREVVDYAQQEGLCVTDSPYPERQGGTDIGQIKTILEEAGLDSEVRNGMTQSDLAREIDSGGGVIAAVKAAEVWPADATGGPEIQAAERSQPGTDHAVWVTGVSRSPEGQVTGFYMNDTGLNDGAGRFVASGEMVSGWEQRGGQAVVSRRIEK